MNMHRGLKFCLILFGGIALLVLIYMVGYAVAENLNRRNTSVNDNQAIALPREVRTVKAGEVFAKERAERWKKNFVLEHASAEFNSIEDLKSLNGSFSYSYGAKNTENFGYPYFFCIVEIDTSKQAVTNFMGLGDDDGDFGRLYMDNWRIDIEDLYTMLKENAPNYVQKKSDDTHILVHCYSDEWKIFDVPNNDDVEHFGGTILRISALDGSIIEKNDME